MRSSRTQGTARSQKSRGNLLAGELEPSQADNRCLRRRGGVPTRRSATRFDFLIDKERLETRPIARRPRMSTWTNTVQHGVHHPHRPTRPEPLYRDFVDPSKPPFPPPPPFRDVEDGRYFYSKQIQQLKADSTSLRFTLLRGQVEARRNLISISSPRLRARRVVILSRSLLAEEQYSKLNH